eukprot:gb/GECH01004430.1/.p1 GENE.gb/GECH01004430.1/~~gb/GECH01004430.1/.p1  ORF type:complete len:229 (+),score=58.36 gb/GECH01004430.1/:1-687(+)
MENINQCYSFTIHTLRQEKENKDKKRRMDWILSRPKTLSNFLWFFKFFNHSNNSNFNSNSNFNENQREEENTTNFSRKIAKSICNAVTSDYLYQYQLNPEISQFNEYSGICAITKQLKNMPPIPFYVSWKYKQGVFYSMTHSMSTNKVLVEYILSQISENLMERLRMQPQKAASDTRDSAFPKDILLQSDEVLKTLQIFIHSKTGQLLLVGPPGNLVKQMFQVLDDQS